MEWKVQAVAATNGPIETPWENVSCGCQLNMGSAWRMTRYFWQANLDNPRADVVFPTRRGKIDQAPFPSKSSAGYWFDGVLEGVLPPIGFHRLCRNQASRSESNCFHLRRFPEIWRPTDDETSNLCPTTWIQRSVFSITNLPYLAHLWKTRRFIFFTNKKSFPSNTAAALL